MTATDLTTPVSTGHDLDDYRQAVAGTRAPGRRWDTAGTTEGVVIVSIDSHVSPPVEAYRQYCPEQFLEDFDEFARPEVQARITSNAPTVVAEKLRTMFPTEAEYLSANPILAAMETILSDDGIGYDPRTRLSRLDEDGVAAEVIFHGGSDFIPVPFIGGGDKDLPSAPELSGLVGDPWKQGAEGAALAAAGMRMYNRWLADFCSEAPGRYLGLALLPMWDVEAAVREVEFAREHGLVGVNFPGPRPALPSYGDLLWEPLWSACESLNMTLHTHITSAGRTAALGEHTGPNYMAAMMLDVGYASRRAVPMMIYGLVFQRHPGLKMLITESTADWIPGLLHDLDSQRWGVSSTIVERMDKLPSEFFWDHIYIGDSFMSNDEARTAVADGTVDNVMWGRDYPHPEGVWPYTKYSVRNTMEGIPADAARKMLGLNAVDVLGLDLAKLQAVAGEIGPSIDEVMTPLGSDELPAGRLYGRGFRSPGQGVL